MRSTLSTSMPIPKIMARAPFRSRLRPCRPHQLFHVPHRLGQTVGDGARHDGVADVELDDFRNCGDRLDVMIVEAVTRIHGEPEARGEFRGRAKALEFPGAGGSPRIGISAGVEFY